MLKFAAAALATMLRCWPGTYLPSRTSIGTMFAPLAIIAAPFTRSITVWLPVPLAPAAAATFVAKGGSSHSDATYGRSIFH